MAEIILENVNKTYPGGITAIKDVSLNIMDKQFAVLVGPSGSGKSTILRLIAGLEEVTEGKVYLGDRLINDVEPKDRDVAMVFQNYALYPHMTVYKNMAYGLKLRKYSKADISKRVSEAAEILKISHLLERKPKELSGGEQQRVAVGRAIVRHPKVFLFDEPLSNLDARLRLQMRTEIKRLHKDLQTTMIYVTHDQTEAMTMGDIIIVLDNGEIQQIADPLTLYDKPCNQFVAEFIGNPPMNLIGGKIVEYGDDLFFESQGLSLEIENPISEKLKRYIETEVIFGIRPEHINLPNQSSGDSGTTIDATVDMVEPLGNETLLYLTIAKNQIVARANSHILLNVNSNLAVTFDMKKAHFFGESDGIAIV